MRRGRGGESSSIAHPSMPVLAPRRAALRADRRVERTFASARHLRSRARQRQSWQYAFERRALALVLARQHQAFAQVVLRFVDREPGRIRCNLEQDSARLPVVDRLEIGTVDDWRHVVAKARKVAAPLQLLRSVWRPPGDVVNRAWP